MIANLKVGNWVVDDMGEWCKITRIDWFDDRNFPDEDKIWGYWGNAEDGNDNTNSIELFTRRDCIVSKHRTKKEAIKYAEFVLSTIEEEDDDI